MPTINDVAERAAVSTATVSYVINKSRYVSDELTARVLKAVSDLQFRPSRVARNLRQGKTFSLGLVLEDVTHRFAGALFKGIEESATRHGYSILISDIHGDPKREEASINLLLGQRVEGIIYAGYGQAVKLLEGLESEGVPVVVVDKPLDSPSLSSVLIDNRAGLFSALRHLKTMGYQDLIFINGMAINRNAQQRDEAFRDFLKRHGLPQVPDQVRYGNYTLQHGFQTTVKILQEKRPCRAIVCGDDTIAFGVLAALKAARKKIPEDVAVVGFDNDLFAQVMDPPLSTVLYPAREMGQVAFEVFHRRHTRKRKQPEHVVLPTKLLVRRSTDPSCRLYENIDGIPE
ncbi:MAG: LacI family DNA-binding transcriptional regulator [Opitutaceae bacterium]|nr:LacI family DNA-binding transcriptional regulator [Opitutaceae bacterium]